MTTNAIRAYTKEDIPIILEGLKAWLQEKEGMLLPEYMDMNVDVQIKNYTSFFKKKVKQMEKLRANDPKDSYLHDYYLYDDGTIKGFIFIDVYNNPGITPMTGAEIGGLYVFKEYRKEGIGTKLFDYVVALAKESGSDKIVLTAENEVTREYYMSKYGAKIYEYSLLIPIKEILQ